MFTFVQHLWVRNIRQRGLGSILMRTQVGMCFLIESEGKAGKVRVVVLSTQSATLHTPDTARRLTPIDIFKMSTDNLQAFLQVYGQHGFPMTYSIRRYPPFYGKNANPLSKMHRIYAMHIER